LLGEVETVTGVFASVFLRNNLVGVYKDKMKSPCFEKIPHRLPVDEVEDDGVDDKLFSAENTLDDLLAEYSP
jgi:hypothetical protein